ncbi:GNAT family N-acetyltransferase [Streptomyces sp. PTM05]|uniref:GNAT family N-acetyltransferase n=1 Tax=Streptantibioticus parmotrematis TaxID=2873249 RepID=A0ABS7QKQ3_9ACTN|nr:GNAT family N-acetyltransferase [Streptantibioticus parmotrematis]
MVSYEAERTVLREGRVVLWEVLPQDAARIADGGTAGLSWIDGLPGDGTVDAAGIVLKAAIAGTYVPGWGVYCVLRAEDEVAVGGIGFHGPPLDGEVEIGYDLSVSARGAGWATDALRLLSGWALGRPGVGRAVATTEPSNTPSQGVLSRAGYSRVSDRDGLWAYELAAAPE